MGRKLDTKIKRLRQLMVDADELKDVHDYFHDECVSDGSFIAAGRRKTNPRLTAVLEATLRCVAPTGKLPQPVMLHLKKHGLWHGYALWGDGQAIFVHFESIDLGLCCYSRSLAASQTHFMRFSGVVVDGVVLPGPVSRGQA